MLHILVFHSSFTCKFVILKISIDRQFILGILHMFAFGKWRGGRAISTLKPKKASKCAPENSDGLLEDICQNGHQSTRRIIITTL